MVKAGVLTLGSILRLMWGNHRNGEGAVTWFLKDWLLGGWLLDEVGDKAMGSSGQMQDLF